MAQAVGIGEDEAVANAWLIAAAPKLLAACEAAKEYITEILLLEKRNLRQNCEYGLQTHRQLNQVIAEAKEVG